MKCSLCETPIPTGSSRCPSCRRWNVGSTTSRQRKRLSDVESTIVERLGLGAMGATAMGGGYPLGCVTLLGGEPGCGKSTLALQLSAHVESCLYIASEESEIDVKARASRIAVPEILDRVEIFSALGGAHIDGALESGPPCRLVILDSLPGLVGAGNDAGGAEAIRALKRHVVANRSHAIVIDHATKDDFFAGRLTLQHDVDTTVVMYAETADERVIVSIKNRHGASGVKEYTILGDRGHAPKPSACNCTPAGGVHASGCPEKKGRKR